MRNDAENIIGSIKDCLADISDIGYFVAVYQPQDVYTYAVRISKPLRFGSDMNLDDYSNMVDFIRQAQTSKKIDIHRGTETYMEIRKSISFLCSYIPDMYGVVIKSMRMEFTRTQEERSYNETKDFTISKKDFTCEPIYLEDRNISRRWVSLFESKLYPGIMGADVKHIDIIFEREIPESIRRMMDDILKEEIVVEKESWFKRLIKIFK
jgi:hypothetical protein